MVINWYGEGCFKIQTGGLTLLTDPFDSSTGLNPARGKVEIVLKTFTEWPLSKEKFEEATVVVGAGEYEVRGVEIKGFDLSKESSDKSFKTAYFVKAEEINLCFLGHIGEYPENELLDKLEDVDVVFMPAGGKPFIDEEAAAKFIKQLEPKIVVASFIKVPGLKRKSGDGKDFAKELGLKIENEEKLVLKKKDLLGGKTKLVSLSI
ncbi:MAG: MBL fold metallo-hydrolase [Candidatus Pacebacteria bacterium]|nr:MBL fold metallo-hydrolase [Candidatus Paceibacterota bacterium]